MAALVLNPFSYLRGGQRLLPTGGYREMAAANWQGGSEPRGNANWPVELLLVLDSTVVR